MLSNDPPPPKEQYLRKRREKEVTPRGRRPTHTQHFQIEIKVSDNHLNIEIGDIMKILFWERPHCTSQFWWAYSSCNILLSPCSLPDRSDICYYLVIASNYTIPSASKLFAIWPSLPLHPRLSPIKAVLRKKDTNFISHAFLQIVHIVHCLGVSWQNTSYISPFLDPGWRCHV